MQKLSEQKKFKKKFSIFTSLILLNHKQRYGHYAIQSISNGFLTQKQIDVLTLYFKRKFKKKCSFFFTNKPLHVRTRKPKGVRMGGGKGKSAKVIWPITKGNILFSLQVKKGVPVSEITRQLNNKLPIKVRFILFKGVVV